MASSSPNKNSIVRAAAILTNSEVKGLAFDLNQADGAGVSIRTQFTKGSLTNGIFAFYVSMDGVTWTACEDGAGNIIRTLTANDDRATALFAPGWKFCTVGVTGTGTVTSSSATVSINYLKRGSQR